MRVYLRTFGCRANQYDSEVVRGMIERSGGEMVAAPEEADVAIFNSCAVTAEAEADLRQSVRRAARRRPGLRSVVMGCAPALPRAADALRSLPSVETLVPNADFAAVAAALALDAESADARPPAQAGTRALLRIQDGCDQHCTFCATTLARGASRSRAADAIVAEASALADRHAEIVLTGVHIGAYGAELGSSLGELVARLVREVPDVRFRLTSIEATEVDDGLAELLTGATRRVAPHLHAPLQSGSDRLLRRMGRHWYTAAAYAAAVERLAGRCKLFAFGGDVIAGFPGETEDDHRRTMALVEALPFTSLHVFPYSARPGTAAERLLERVSAADVARRAAELRALGVRKAAAHRARRVGGEADVIVVGAAAGKREGLTEDYLSVALADPSLPRGSRFDATLVDTHHGLTAAGRR